MNKVIWFPSISQWLEILEWRKFYRVLRNLDSEERIKNNSQNLSIECIEMACFKAAETVFKKGNWINLKKDADIIAESLVPQVDNPAA